MKGLLILFMWMGISTAEVFFTSGAIWNQDISKATLDPLSLNTTAWLMNNGGWGNGDLFQIDFSMVINRGGSSAPQVPVAKTSYTFPDCDNVTTFPVPSGGAIEGQTGLQCSGGDCHFLVYDAASNLMWESYLSNVNAGSLQSGCVAVWNLTEIYPKYGRGEQCTSADAAGFPVAPLLFNVNELVAGEISHAIRFILPNDRIQASLYVHPGSHGTSPPGASAPPPAPIYGSRWRLSANFNVSSLSSGAQVVARALQKYGMFLSDGGNIALTAESDMFFTNKWANIPFNSHSLFGIQPTDFEVVASSDPPVPLTFSCTRDPNSFPKELTTLMTTSSKSGVMQMGISVVFIIFLLVSILFG